MNEEVVADNVTALPSITLTTENLTDPQFITSWRKLASHNGFPVKVAFRISTLTKRMTSLTDDVRKIQEGMVEKYAKKTEEGHPVPSGDAQMTGIPFVLKEDSMKDGFIKEATELKAFKHILKGDKITEDQLKGIELSADDISALEPFIALEV